MRRLVVAGSPSGARGRRSPVVVVGDARRAWRRVSPFFAGSRWQVGLLAVVSVVAGFAEAALLALVAAIAGALSQGSRVVSRAAALADFHICWSLRAPEPCLVKDW